MSRFKPGTTLPDHEFKPIVYCDFPGCTAVAVVNLKGKNLCHVKDGLSHYIEHFNAEALVYAAQHNLRTVEDHRQHIRKLLGLFIDKQKKVLEREPGSDDA